MDGIKAVFPQATGEVLRRSAGDRGNLQAGSAGLHECELPVLKSAAAGFGNKEIACRKVALSR